MDESLRQPQTFGMCYRCGKIDFAGIWNKVFHNMRDKAVPICPTCQKTCELESLV